jgi:hypothetical protein
MLMNGRAGRAGGSGPRRRDALWTADGELFEVAEPALGDAVAPALNREGALGDQVPLHRLRGVAELDAAPASRRVVGGRSGLGARP